MRLGQNHFLTVSLSQTLAEKSHESLAMRDYFLTMMRRISLVPRSLVGKRLGNGTGM